jgi:hypothetical protein
MTDEKKLEHRTIFVVGREEIVRPYTDKIRAQGATVIFTKTTPTPEGTIETAKITDEITELSKGTHRLDAVLVFHPETSEPILTFQPSSPIRRLVDFTRMLCIPSLTIEHPPVRGLDEAMIPDNNILRGMSGTFQHVGSTVNPDLMLGYLSYVIKNKVELTTPKPSGRGAA